MLPKLRGRLRAVSVRYREKRERWAANAMVALAAFPGKLKLRRARPLRVLIDNSVLRHGLTHTNDWISTGTKLWGGVIPFDAGYRARVPRTYPESHAEIYEKEIPFFAPLARLGKEGYICFCTSRHLQVERMRQPGFDRFQFGYNVWSRVSLELLPEVPGTTASASIISKQWFSADAQIDRILREADPDFLHLSRCVARKHILDLYHVWTAKHGNCSVFLTDDKRLKRIVDALPLHARAMLEPVSIKLPSDLGRELGLHPVGHKYLTPIDVDWFYVIR